VAIKGVCQEGGRKVSIMNTESTIDDKPTTRLTDLEDISNILEIDRKTSGDQRTVTYTNLITGDLWGKLKLSYVAVIGAQAVDFILARPSYIG